MVKPPPSSSHKKKNQMNEKVLEKKELESNRFFIWSHKIKIDGMPNV